MDLVFLDSFYWLFMNKEFVTMSTAIFTFIAVVISLLLIIKKWGEEY